MLQSSISTKGLIAIPRPVLCGANKALLLTPCRRTPTLARETTDRQPLVCSAEAQSPNSSGTSFVDYALGQGTYQLVSGLLTVWAVAFIFAAPWVAENIYGVTLLPVAELVVRSMGSLMLIPAALCFTLQSAVEENRLDSPTYKRSSFAVALTLLVICGFKFFNLSQGLVMSDLGIWLNTTVQLLPTVAFLKLYGMSTMQDIIPGFISGVTSLFQPDNINAAIYSVLSAGAMGYALVAMISPTSLASFMLNKPLDAFAKLLVQDLGAMTFLLSIALFTLKDAADRGRLGFTTFKNLSIAAFLTAAAKIGSTLYVNRNAGGQLVTRNSLILLAVVYGSLALVSGYNVLMTKKE